MRQTLCRIPHSPQHTVERAQRKVFCVREVQHLGRFQALVPEDMEEATRESAEECPGECIFIEE